MRRNILASLGRRRVSQRAKCLIRQRGAGITFLGPWGPRVLFFRLPMVTVARGFGIAQCVSGWVMNEEEEQGRSEVWGRYTCRLQRGREH